MNNRLGNGAISSLLLVVGLVGAMAVPAAEPPVTITDRQAQPYAGKSLDLTAEEQVWLQTHPRIRVHNELAWPPFNFNENARPQGFSIDYMNLLADKIGIDIQYVSGPSWGEFLEMMKSGDLEVMLNIVKTPDRQIYLLYTGPYIDNPNTILSRRDAPYDNLEQLFGKTISVPKGFFYEEILTRDYPQIRLHLVKDTLEAMKAVTFGKADAALGELAVFNHLLVSHFMTDLVLSGEVKMGSPEYALLNIAARMDLPLLASILDKAVRSVDRSELQTIRQKWLEGARSGGAQTVKLTEEELTWLSQHREIRLGVDPDYPPFEFMSEDGGYSGIASDYIRIISERLGIEMTAMPELSWSQVLEGAKNRTLDVLPAVAQSAERDPYLSFTRVHLDHQTVIVTREDFPFITGLGDLDGQTVAMVRGYVVTATLKSDYPSLTPREYDKPLDALEAVAVGEATATVMNLPVATYLIRQNALNNLKLASKAEIDLPGLSIGVRKDWPELVSILDKVLASITPEERKALQDRWVGLEFEPGIDLALVRQVSAIAGVIVVAILLWIWSLRREINQRRKVEEAQQTILQAVSLPIIVVRRATGEIMYVNEAAAAGRPPDSMIGRSANDIYLNASDRERLLEIMNERGQVDSFEVQLKGSGDESIWALMSSRVITFEGHSAFLTTYTDITQGKRAAEQIQATEARLADAIESISYGIVLYDANLTLIVCNSVFREIYGYSEEEAAPGASGLVDLDAERGLVANGEEYVARMYEYRRNPVGAMMIELTDGRWIEIRDRRTSEGGVVSVHADVTDRVLEEQSLVEAKEEAEAVGKAKSEFVAVVSHEVRTPMNGVLGMTRLLLETPLTTEQQEYAETILHSGEALLTILNDLLDISKLEAGKLELEAISFAPRPLVNDTVNLMGSTAREKGLELSCHIEPHVAEGLIGDANRLRQILFNLLSNAIKFTARGGVTVIVDGVEVDDGRVQLAISVTDTGPGIGAEAAEKLFAPYVQANVDVARRYGGTGLGLSICRRLAELMGGEIKLESVVGEGSTFKLTAPFEITSDVPGYAAMESGLLAELRDGSDGARAAGGATSRALRILVVEDNLINRKVARGFLSKLGHRVVVANDGREALAAIDAEDPFDVVLMDRHMPVMDGIEATRRIRAMDGPVAEVPIVALTAAATQSEVKACLDAGMNDIVTKPIDPRELAGALARAVPTVALLSEAAPVADLGSPAETSLHGDSEPDPVLDPAVLEQLAADFDVDAVAEFTGDFLAIGPKGVEGFHEGTRAVDVAKMTLHAHDLKSSAAMLGLTRLSQLCRRIELACKEERVDEALALGTGLKPALDRAIEALVGRPIRESSEDARVRSRLLERTAHNLRDRMNTILGYVRVLEEYSQEDAALEDVVDVAVQIQRSGDELRDVADTIVIQLDGQRVQGE